MINDFVGHIVEHGERGMDIEVAAGMSGHVGQDIILSYTV
jgi:hypothetical protein